MADFTRNALAVAAASQTLVMGTDNRPQASVRVTNDGAANVTFFVFRTGETPVAAVDAANGGFCVHPAETVEVPANIQWGRSGITAITIVAAGAGSTVRVFAPQW